MIVFDLERTNQLNLLPDQDLVDLCHLLEPYQVTKNPSYLYKKSSGEQYANAIVYVDEANRFIPQTPKDKEQEALQKELIDGIKTTRQYGLAWWLADQRPSAISKDAFTQMGTFFFGQGMTAVAD